MNNKIIFIINGSGGKGKDTFVKLCSKYTSVFNISSVDKVKEAATILGWNGDKSEKDRKFLAVMKYLSSNYNNQPYKYIKNKIEEFKANSDQVMFIHIREPKEIDIVKKDFNCKTLLIKNINVGDIKSNQADANVENYNYDYIIHNDDNLIQLDKEAFMFLKEVINE